MSITSIQNFIIQRRQLDRERQLELERQRQTRHRIPVYPGRLVIYHDPSRGPLHAVVVSVHLMTNYSVSFSSISFTIILVNPIQS